MMMTMMNICHLIDERDTRLSSEDKDRKSVQLDKTSFLKRNSIHEGLLKALRAVSNKHVMTVHYICSDNISITVLNQ